jgi:hypothetical protein
MAKPLLLVRHPDTPSSASTLPVWAGRVGGLLMITYRIPGDTSGLVLPPKQETEIRDRLWEHTCFEAFVRPSGSAEYIELNFSPSTQWAAYRFDDYREGMRAFPVGYVPKIVSTPWHSRFELSAGLEMPIEWQPLAWNVNITAVLEERDGARSYWALAHPPGDPDFHHRDCFVLELPPAD